MDDRLFMEYEVSLTEGVASYDSRRTVEPDFDAAARSGSSGKPVVVEFTGVLSDRKLDIEFVPKSGSRNNGSAPVVNFIEVIAENVVKAMRDNESREEKIGL